MFLFRADSFRQGSHSKVLHSAGSTPLLTLISKFSRLEELTSWEIFFLLLFYLFFYFYKNPPPTPPSPTAVNVMWERVTPEDPAQSRSPLRLPSHNANKQERDSFLPTVTHTWNPSPPPTPFFLPSPRGFLHPLSSVPHPVTVTWWDMGRRRTS